MRHADKHRHSHIIIASGFLAMVLVCLATLCSQATTFLPATKRTGVEHGSPVSGLVAPSSFRKILRSPDEKASPSMELAAGPDPVALPAANPEFEVPCRNTACPRLEKPTFLCERRNGQCAPRAPPVEAPLAGA